MNKFHLAEGCILSGQPRRVQCISVLAHGMCNMPVVDDQITHWSYTLDVGHTTR